MKIKFSNSFSGYFLFYYGILGNRLFLSLMLSILISFLDGLGLAMFIPLLQQVADEGGNTKSNITGGLKYFTDLIEATGLTLNIWTILSLLVGLFVLKGCIKFFEAINKVRLKHRFMKTIRFSLVDSLANLKYVGFLKLDAGRIQNTLTAEIQRLVSGMNSYFNAAQSLVMLLTYVFLAFVANYQFAFLVALGAFLSNFLYKKIYVATKKTSLKLSTKGNDFNGYLIQSINHFKYLKSTNYFTLFTKKLKRVILDTENLSRKLSYYGAITSSVREPMIIIIVVVVIVIQIRWMGTSFSSILLSLLLFYRSLNFLMVIQNNWQGFIQTIGSMNSIATLTAEMDEEREVQEGQLFEELKSRIEINDISFSYGTHHVIRNLSLEMRKNTTIALVGESGSGKTTLANLIAGLVEPTTGSILIDGIDLMQLKTNSYRNKIGYISQEPVVFNDNIYNNITFWDERTEENEARFWEIIKLASLENFIDSQPQKELTMLGDNGILVSGGQKQRISIARELYKKAEILILDEATSALDSETERVIQDNINKLHGSYTMVIIAHRLSTIKEADQIYLLEKGKILNSGTFSEMIDSSPKFQRMVALQEF